MTLLRKIAQVAVEQEAVEGTAETILAADVFKAFDVEFEPAIEAHPRNYVDEYFSPFSSIMGARSATIRFSVHLVGHSGGAGTAPPYSDALQACGLSETIVASTSVTYKPDSTSAVPSATVQVMMNGLQYKAWGARGNVTITLEKGMPGVLTFEFTAADFSITDVALLNGVSYDTALPPAFMGATFTLDTFADVISRLEFDLANEVVLRPDINKSSGHVSAIITGKRPVVTLDPEAELVATEDFWGNWRSGSTMALSCAIGSAAGNTHTITAPAVQFESVGEGERDGIAILEPSGLLVRSSGDDEFSWAIT